MKAPIIISMVADAVDTATHNVLASKIISAIQQGKWKTQVEQIRRLYAKTIFRTGDRKAAKEAVASYKKKLPGILWSGTFTSRASDALIQYSWLLCVDIDDVESEELKAVRAKLLASPYLVALFLSPTGRGLKAIFRVPADPSKHLASFRAIEKHVRELAGVQIDRSGKDLARMCFVSYDADCYYNPDAREIEPLPEPLRLKVKAKTNDTINLNERQRITAEVLGTVDWQSETSGFCTCPGKHLHTTGDNDRDCKIELDNVPTVHCFHNHCRGIVDGVNHELRSRIGKVEYKPEATPFPLHCLPQACEAMARAVCEMARVLESLPGCCALGFLSAAIGAGLQVRSGANRVTRGNVYILPSAESGSGKSETFRHLAKPFLIFEANLVATWKTKIKPGLLAERKILEAEIATLTKSAGKPNGSTKREEIREQLRQRLAALDNVDTKLRTPALSCEDVTGEKLAVLLADNAEQLASLSPDAVAVVNILLGRYNKLDRTDEGIYLKSFTGDRCKVDRQSRDAVLLESPCLAALWLTQPDKLDSLLAERSLSDGGLIPRILACHTHCEAQEIVQGAPEIPATIEEAYTDLIRSLIKAYRLADEPFTIEPTSEALDAMNAHYNAIVKRRRTDLRDVTIYAARWNEQAWRIAVCLHAGLHGAHVHERKLELDTAKCAMEIAEWFASQQLEILSGSREKARRDKWDEVLALADEKPEGIRASDVYRRRIVRNADVAHTLLSEMEAAGELSGRDEQPDSGGHVTRIFTRAKK